ncbi:MAG: DUF302 domain-containing protein [Rhodobacter sp.]|nr:DUF302 domain-containing protein [Rhodobacter sp.]
MKPFLITATLAFAGLAGVPGSAQDAVTYATDDSFDDATFAVESAIVDRGLVIDYVSHVGEMLARTKADVGGSVDIFDAADVFLFCSAKLSRQVMEADPMNVAHCPYAVFVTDQGGAVKVGYRNLPAGSMDVIRELLDGIAREAAGQ